MGLNKNETSNLNNNDNNNDDDDTNLNETLVRIIKEKMIKEIIYDLYKDLTIMFNISMDAARNIQVMKTVKEWK